MALVLVFAAATTITAGLSLIPSFGDGSGPNSLLLIASIVLLIPAVYWGHKLMTGPTAFDQDFNRNS